MDGVTDAAAGGAVASWSEAKCGTVVADFGDTPTVASKTNYLTNSRIARSSPSKVSGYIRPPMSWRIMPIEWV